MRFNAQHIYIIYIPGMCIYDSNKLTKPSKLIKNVSVFALMFLMRSAVRRVAIAEYIYYVVR